MTKLASLSLEQARKAVLLSQGIHKEHKLGSGQNATLKAIENLGYVQIDTISVVERAHHHTLWSRANGYQALHLDQLLEKRQVFEYWSHAAAYLPMRDFRYSLPYKHEIASGAKHWRNKDKKLMALVLKRIAEEGPLQARNFERARKGETGWWEWKPAKIALEQLFIEGELMIARRQGFQKVYDLPERILPTHVDTSRPSTKEFYDHLIDRYLQANAVGSAAQIAYLRRGHKPKVAKRCAQLVEDGKLIELNIGQNHYYATSAIEQLLSNKLSRSRVKILSPFDNLLIQRKRTKELFDFDYLIECYVPAKKRQYGYFCLPLLWGQQFAGRMDAKIERRTGVLTIRKLHLETSQTERFLAALKKPLKQFLLFNNGRHIKLEQVFYLGKAISKKDFVIARQHLCTV